MTIAHKGIQVTLVSTYRAYKQAMDLDKSSVCMQRSRVLLGKRRNPPDPRKQTLEDLKRFFKDDEERGGEVILIINANKGMENRTDEMIYLINECKLIDVHT